jgi:hypothetical protein
MERVSGNVIRGILFVFLLAGSLVVRARANAIACEECYGTFSTPAYCEDKENGRIKDGTCKVKDKTTCTGKKCGGKDEDEEEEFDAVDDNGL